MTPEELSEAVWMDAERGIYMEDRSYEDAIKRAVLKHLATYDPVGTIMRDERWSVDWLLHFSQKDTDAPFSVMNTRTNKIIATGKTALEACRNAIEQEKTT